MDEKQYMIDNKPASAKDLINAAKALGYDYSRFGFCSTSGAAKVLRDNGYEVGYNPDHKQSA